MPSDRNTTAFGIRVPTTRSNVCTKATTSRCIHAFAFKHVCTWHKVESDLKCIHTWQGSTSMTFRMKPLSSVRRPALRAGSSYYAAWACPAPRIWRDSTKEGKPTLPPVKKLPGFSTSPNRRSAIGSCHRSRRSKSLSRNLCFAIG